MKLLPFLCKVSCSLLIAASAHAQTPLDYANWISPAFKEDTTRPPVIFLHDFTISKPVANATLWITAHGLYESTLNGKRIGNAYFTPGWTNYNKRLAYQVYDVKQYLKRGNNNLMVTVGEGWYRGVFGGMLARDNYGSDASIICKLHVKYADGSQVEVVTDSSWRSTTGRILHADLYNGETIDCAKGIDNTRGVIVEEYPKEVLFLSSVPPVEKHERFKPVSYITTPASEQVIDFGQNLAGWVELRVKGKKGDTICIQHAEVLDKNGNFYTGNLRAAKATDTYILSGKGVEVLAPHFTSHGFRYIKVSGADMRKMDVTAVAIYSSVAPAGSFECSDTLVNKLYHNITWSLKSNFLDLPTDCPQRSERLGWTADAQVFLGTAAYMYDVSRFYSKWMDDLASEQRSDGSVPNVIPNIYYKVVRPRYFGVAGWGDAATIVPMSLFDTYNDTTVVRSNYGVMKKWVQHIASNSKEYLWEVPGYGDWLAPGDSTSLPFIDQCFWFHSVNNLVRAAEVLGEARDVALYEKMAFEVQKAFLKKYVAQDGSLLIKTQTAYVLALRFGLLPHVLQTGAAEQLAELIKANQYHLATGFLGTPYLLQVLTENGYNDLAYRLLLQKSYPSWLYAVTKGATTIWERWDAIRPDGDVMPISYNHYAYGAVGEWLYRYVGGIQPFSPGYSKIMIAPRPGPGLTWVNCSYRCSYGTIVSNWRVVDGKTYLHVKIPQGTTAIVLFPGNKRNYVDAGEYDFVQ